MLTPVLNRKNKNDFFYKNIGIKIKLSFQENKNNDKDKDVQPKVYDFFR